MQFPFYKSLKYNNRSIYQIIYMQLYRKTELKLHFIFHFSLQTDLFNNKFTMRYIQINIRLVQLIWVLYYCNIKVLSKFDFTTEFISQWKYCLYRIRLLCENDEIHISYENVLSVYSDNDSNLHSYRLSAYVTSWSQTNYTQLRSISERSKIPKGE